MAIHASASTTRGCAGDDGGPAATAAAARPASAPAWLQLTTLALSLAGLGVSLYLIYTELFTLDAICLWCTSVHVITVLLFALIVPTATAPARAG